MSDINVLLLGETGVGKSTFINALANYLQYEKLTDAEQKFIQLVPTTFQLAQSNEDATTVSTGVHANENQQIGSSATINPLIHTFTYKQRVVRMIDTPGIGDTRGMIYDDQNTKKLFAAISKLNHLNAICIVLKSSDSRLNAFFSYCVKYVLSQLNRSLRENVLFLLTNSRVTSFKPDSTGQTLRVALQEIGSSGTIIPLGRQNTFCVDNESFRYLAARSQGLNFPAEEVEVYERSWNESSKECKRLLECILTLHQAPTQITVSIRDSKAVIAKMARPLIEIMVLHQKAISRIKRHKEDISDRKNSIEDLKTKLYTPIIQYKITRKIITDSEVGHKITAGGFFTQGGFGLGAKGKHESRTKTHTEEYVEPYETQIEDAGVKAMFVSETNRLEVVKQKLDELETMQVEYDEELKVIVEAAVRFVVFVNENAISSSGDPFQQYIEEVLKEERRCNGSPEFINNLDCLLTRYKFKKANLSNITSDDIQDSISRLLGLKHAGPQFRQLYNELLD